VLIKAADDKSKRLALLEDLQRSPLLDRRQKDWLRDELHRTRRGIAGERDAAHYLDNYLKDDPDRAVLHDLRFKVDGDVIQIDHLIITRSLYVYLLETKNFNGNVRINEHGEFSVQYGGEREFGIPSPLEQSRRHEGPLRKLFETLEIKGRNGRAPLIQHCMLVTPASMIHRPAAGTFDTTNVIKADQFRGWHEKFQDRTGIGETCRHHPRICRKAGPPTSTRRSAVPAGFHEAARTRGGAGAGEDEARTRPRGGNGHCSNSSRHGRGQGAGRCPQGRPAQAHLRDLRSEDHLPGRQVLLEQRAAVRRAAVLPRTPGRIRVSVGAIAPAQINWASIAARSSSECTVAMRPSRSS